MTLREKIGQMTQADKGALTTDQDIATYALGSLLSGGGGGPSGAGGTATQWADMVDHYQSIALTSRLHIPLIYGVDAVHGHSNVYGAVIFPHNIGMGATRNPALVQQAQHITALEVAGTGIDWTFAPCLCVPRDERWGRTYEGYGETPDLVSSYSAAAVRGFQGTSLANPDSIMATAKHYVGDGGTTWGTGSGSYQIDQGDTQISEQELRNIHLAAYIPAIQEGVGSIMISYSSWNGKKCTGTAT
jgi:beta-glucosidase